MNPYPEKEKANERIEIRLSPSEKDKLRQLANSKPMAVWIKEQIQKATPRRSAG
mgnify:CR=1 FL=1